MTKFYTLIWWEHIWRRVKCWIYRFLEYVFFSRMIFILYTVKMFFRSLVGWSVDLYNRNWASSFWCLVQIFYQSRFFRRSRKNKTSGRRKGQGKNTRELGTQQLSWYYYFFEFHVLYEKGKIKCKISFSTNSFKVGEASYKEFLVAAVVERA